MSSVSGFRPSGSFRRPSRAERVARLESARANVLPDPGSSAGSSVELEPDGGASRTGGAPPRGQLVDEVESPAGRLVGRQRTPGECEAGPRVLDLDTDATEAGARNSRRAARSAAARTAGADRVDLARALDKVPREARVLLALRYVDGLGYGELARIRGISVNTVKSQLARGKAILKTALEAGGHDGSD